MSAARTGPRGMRPLVDRLQEAGYDVTAEGAVQETVCEEADRLVAEDRESDYGSPHASARQIAQLWNTLFCDGDDFFSPEDVGVAFAAAKLSRLAGGEIKRDSLVDLAGYARFIERVIDEAPAGKERRER